MIEYKITNVVSCGEIDPIRHTTLEKLLVEVEKIPGFSAEYNPETFPGLVIRSEEPKASFLLFQSGKIVCAGTKSVESLRIAFETFDEKITPLTKKRRAK